MSAFNRRQFLKTTGAGLAALPLAGAIGTAFAQEKKKRPNILFVLADDLGWRDTNPFGATFYETPNIQRLAQRGMLFTQAYAANPLCSPTRSSILTGQYPARTGFTAPWGHGQNVVFEPTLAKTAPPHMKTIQPGSATRLRNSYYTLGNAFKDAGYATAFFGKWHMGHDPYIAANQGFDTVEGGGPHPGPPSYFSPWHMAPYHEDGPPGKHIDDHLAEQAIAFIRENKDHPFYCNLWFYDVHAPYQGKEDLIEKYKNKEVAEDAPRRNTTMAAMIETLDTALGRVLDELDAQGLTEDTMVIFFSDNGGVHWREADNLPPNTSNHPLRSGKGSTYEGGVREPMIVAWPGVTKENSQTDAFVSSVDFYPTLLEIIGIKPKEDQPVDGISFLPVLSGGKATRDVVYGYMPHQVPYPPNTPQNKAGVFLNYPSSTVRVGDWKLIRFHYDGPQQQDRFELYNLKDDIGESKNLAEKYPEKVAEMDAMITEFHKEMGTLLPVANPNYKNPEKINWEGWVAGGDGYFDKDGEFITLVSDGDDPYMHTTDFPDCLGPAKLRVRMKSTLQRQMQIFWNLERAPNFSQDRSQMFEVEPGGKWQDYEMAIPGNDRVILVRIDPGVFKGKAVFEHIELLDKNGKVVRRWDGKMANTK